jgi:hypothetical protein
MKVIGWHKVEAFVVRYPQSLGPLQALMARLEIEGAAGVIAMTSKTGTPHAFNGHNLRVVLANCEVTLRVNFSAQSILISEIAARPSAPPETTT